VIRKTKGIVIHNVKYGESGFVVRFYTKDHGRLTVLVKGTGKKQGKRHNLLQPLSILDLEIYFRETRELHNLKEFNQDYIPLTLYTDIRKTSVILFLSELLNAVLNEENPNAELFDYIERSIVFFDSSRKGYANFHIAFLSGLINFLGFEPSLRVDASCRYFDLLEGIFIPVPPLHGNYATPEISNVLSDFFSSSFEDSLAIPLTGKQRNEVLEILVKYFSIHLPGIKTIKSLDVLKEVFT